jgi:hypothetical protein
VDRWGGSVEWIDGVGRWGRSVEWVNGVAWWIGEVGWCGGFVERWTIVLEIQVGPLK